MRLGVLDVGSNTVHLLVVDAHSGARPLPAYSHKAELKLAELLDADGAISPDGIDRLSRTLADALQVAEDQGVEDLLPFATSAVREAPNAEHVLGSRRRDGRKTGGALRRGRGTPDVPGRPPLVRLVRGAVAAAGHRRRLAGDGLGQDEEPDVAVSLPLGAGRLTAGWLPDDPPDTSDVRALRRHVRAEIARVAGEFNRFNAPDRVVGTSKTFKQLARITGAARTAEGPYVERKLTRESLEEEVPRLAALPAAERAELPGVSEGRARQLVAGALVAEGALDIFRVQEVTICPWALREGVILRRLDHLRRA